MTRILFNTWGDENCDLNFAVLVIDPMTARWWLDKVKPDVDALNAKYSGRGFSGGFYGIELWDWHPDFMRLDYYEDLPDDLVSEIEGSDFIHLPDDVVLKSAELARMDVCIAVADESGIQWRAREKHSDLEVETPRITWDMLESIADSDPPADNSGRLHCWWCGLATVEEVLFTSATRQCPKCKK